MTSAGPYRLTKGANVSLKELDAELGAIAVILETGDADGAPVDADVSILLLADHGRVRSNDDLVFYNQPIALNGALRLREKGTFDGVTSTDGLTVELNNVPDDVHRIVVAASIDPTLRLTFGHSRLVRLRVQRASDAWEMVEYQIDGTTTETALLFGEFYRRGGDWRLRAIGQGYEGGLGALVADFGVDVDQPESDDQPAGDDQPESDVRPDAGYELAAHVDAVDGVVQLSQLPDPVATDIVVPTTTRFSVRRPIRPPQMPKNWKVATASPEIDRKQHARLFPISGIGTGNEYERRATSALLAVLALVREFGQAITKKYDAPAGKVSAYTEVTFRRSDGEFRPDGVIEVVRGQRRWTAIVEVKTSSGRLTADQLAAYVDIAAREKYDAVLTISNDVIAADGGHPVYIDRRKLQRVRLHHLSWDEVRTEALLLLGRLGGVADQTQRVVLAEFVRYLTYERSGLHGFNDMGPDWVTVRDRVGKQMLGSGDPAAATVTERFDQLVAHVALHLSGLIGVRVLPALPRSSPDTTTRCEQLADTGKLFGVLNVPGAANSLVLKADLRAVRVSCSMDVSAPREGRPVTRINWLLRQLDEASHERDIHVEAQLSGSRPQASPADLRELRTDPARLVPADKRDIRTFRISLGLPMGTRSGTGEGSLIGSILKVTDTFYAEIGQHVRAWSPNSPG